MGIGHKLARLMVGISAIAVVAPVAVASADPIPPFIPVDSPWLTVVNYHRAMAGLPEVVENASFSDGAQKHSCYMLLNGMTHDEIPGRPGYTPEGDAAGNNGNVAVSSVYGTSARSHVELWMTGPFHAIGLLRPNLQSVGFGKCDNELTSPWRSAATLDVLRGLGPKAPISSPILWPGDGTTTSLDRFVAESPDPRSFCGWSGGGGLPVIALMPEAVNAVSASISGPSGLLETCALSRLNTNGVAQSIMSGDNAVVVMPRWRLDPGVYTVTVTTQARTVTWSFTIDPAAANGPSTPTPAPTTETVGNRVNYQPISATRVMDTRQGLGGTRMQAGSSRRIQITGQGGVPSGATAAMLNVTSTWGNGYGYVTLWNCTSSRPTVSAVNYGPFETVANGVSVPLDDNGGLCVYSYRDVDVVIDVNGFFAPSGGEKFVPVAPTRIADSRLGLGIPSRMWAGQAVAVAVRPNWVPEDATAVVVNLTGTGPSYDGFVTAWRCDEPLPLAANLNPIWGQSRANIAVVPIAADGTICLYTSPSVDLVMDLTGYLAPTADLKFQAATPFRLVDTRDAVRTELNQGQNGRILSAGQMIVVQVAGTRGIAADAKGVSANIVSVGAWGRGYITAWPCGEFPTASTNNYDSADAIATGAFLPLSPDGKLCIATSQPTHLVVDVNGWWS